MESARVYGLSVIRIAVHYSALMAASWQGIVRVCAGLALAAAYGTATQPAENKPAATVKI